MGTAITPEQLMNLRRYAGEVVLALDADRAGREAMLRAQRVAGSGQLRLLVAAMPAGKDPADLLLESNGLSRVEEALHGASDLPVFHARAVVEDADLSTPAGKDQALSELIPVLHEMGESFTRQELIREIAEPLDSTPELIARKMQAYAANPDQSSRRPASSADGHRTQTPNRPRRAPTPEEEHEYKMLALCLAEPKQGGDFLRRLDNEHFSSPRLLQCCEWLREHLAAPLDGLDDSEAHLYNAIVRLQAVDHEAPTLQNFEFRLALLERDKKRRQIKAAEKAGDLNRVVRLQRQLGELNDAIHARS
jgi:DNA primase